MWVVRRSSAVEHIAPAPQEWHTDHPLRPSGDGCWRSAGRRFHRDLEPSRTGGRNPDRHAVGDDDPVAVFSVDADRHRAGADRRTETDVGSARARQRDLLLRAAGGAGAGRHPVRSHRRAVDGRHSRRPRCRRGDMARHGPRRQRADRGALSARVGIWRQLHVGHRAVLALVSARPLGDRDELGVRPQHDRRRAGGNAARGRVAVGRLADDVRRHVGRCGCRRAAVRVPGARRSAGHDPTGTAAGNAMGRVHGIRSDRAAARSVARTGVADGRLCGHGDDHGPVGRAVSPRRPWPRRGGARQCADRDGPGADGRRADVRAARPHLRYAQMGRDLRRHGDHPGAAGAGRASAPAHGTRDRAARRSSA